MTRDLRKYSRQTIFRLLVGGIGVIFIIGIGLIYLIYGRNAALMGTLCMFVGLLPLFFVWLFLSIMEWIVIKSKSK
jgi:hypothetical protein